VELGWEVSRLGEVILEELGWMAETSIRFMQCNENMNSMNSDK
jgi:hypothetical protein